ncbi:MAG: SLC13 family permease, partial [Promethearchaeota archaeon]
MSNTWLQILVGFCFFGVIIVLFFEKRDYLTYSVFLVTVAGILSAIVLPEARSLEFFVRQIDWRLIFFLIAMFTIVEVMHDKHIFHYMAKGIINKYKSSPRAMFYFICTISTILAAFVEDLSVAIIFGPIIVITCKKLKINPAPYLLGMTITINIASTLTPFGSAENILIAITFENYSYGANKVLNLNTIWFVKNIGIYFLVSLCLTLVLLDQFVLKKDLKKSFSQACA